MTQSELISRALANARVSQRVLRKSPAPQAAPALSVVISDLEELLRRGVQTELFDRTVGRVIHGAYSREV